MNSNRRPRFLAAGIVVLIVGLPAAAGLWYSAGQRQADAVRNFARAPVGCDTTLNFEVAGEFLVFVETEGEIGGVTGSCGAPGAFGQSGTPQDLPPVRLVLTAPDGTDVALATRTGVDYDADGSSGQMIRAFVVESPGEHVMRVESTNDSERAIFAIAIGRDPNEGMQPLRLGAIAAGAAVLAVGLLLIAMSRRRGAPEAAVLAAPWPTSPPTSRPGQPGQTVIPGQPPFTTPTTPPSAPSPSAPPEMPSE
jgi:hypothetical protein